MRIDLESQDIDALAERLFERIRRVLPDDRGSHDDSDVVFDKKGLAEYLRVSESTISKLVLNKEIPYFKLAPGQSGGVRFKKSAIDKWIEKKTVPDTYPVSQRIPALAS